MTLVAVMISKKIHDAGLSLQEIVAEHSNARVFTLNGFGHQVT